jgi:hypothetical protein
MVLQIALKALNDTTSPNRLVPTLLVFGVYPRIVELDTLSPIVVQQASVIKKAIVEIRKLRAER